MNKSTINNYTNMHSLKLNDEKINMYKSTITENNYIIDYI